MKYPPTNLTSSLRMLLPLLIGIAVHTQARAEPYLAAREGLQCAACHVNPSGGGMRTEFGDVYAQTRLVAKQLDMGERGLWTGKLNDFLRVGGDLRYDASATDTPHQKRSDGFALQEFRAYGAVDLIDRRLTLYADQLLAPGSSINREAYGLFWWDEHQAYVKAGKLYLPYGLRLQDDSSFVRQATGINFTTPDNGLELGWVGSSWIGQLAVSNGAGGGEENDRGKRATASVAYVQHIWRLGASADYNDAAIGKLEQGGIFAGLDTGPITWLAEADYIVDKSLTPTRKQYVGLLEANWAFMQGHNLKLSAEYFDPDHQVDEDQRNRLSAIWEFNPIQFIQTRVGFRRYDGIPQNDLQNRKELFVELHGLF
ncbi:MAG: hypothetical protein JWQ90_4439 [Hydrocarboniphaga sp.]|uniref:hypothetical protein n=1 Tax=Hydrocarboniphaga sp. TaxID=2033016 RepID=UPI0026144E5D|nr:hypothetical protein [Hydrocarboniphaga sp.]MDB5971989.1 hypothetical protein [Hydrocarboniphaga sp.]